jgi:hypothetical protein
MAVAADLIETVRAFDARLRSLQDYGLKIGEPGLAARLKARKEIMASMYAESLRLRDEIDRSGVIPRLIDAYIAGTGDDRLKLRRLFGECRTFARNWGSAGRSIAFPEPPATARQFLRALAVHCMRDGDPDYRDEILLLDSLCKRGGASALELSTLLREGAAMASNELRGRRKSFRDALLERAARAEAKPR